MKRLMVMSAVLSAWAAGCGSDDGGNGNPPAVTGGAGPVTTGGSSGSPAATGGSGGSTGGAPATTGGASSGGATSGGGGTTAGGAGGGGGAGGTSLPPDVPADLSQPGIEAFLKTDVFTSWTWDTETPRPPGLVSPHGRVRVGINETLKNGIDAGLDGSSAEKAFPAGSMALKEMYDEQDVVIGRAFILKRGAPNTAPNWLYYCDGPADRCGVDTGTRVPFYATGNTVSFCNGCHGPYFFIGTE